MTKGKTETKTVRLENFYIKDDFYFVYKFYFIFVNLDINLHSP